MSYPITLNGWGDLADDVDAEVHYARRKFPKPTHLTVALAEECGELIKAIAQLREGKGDYKAVRVELVQTMAMCVRLYLDGDETEGLPTGHPVWQEHTEPSTSDTKTLQIAKPSTDSSPDNPTLQTSNPKILEKVNRLRDRVKLGRF